MKKLILITLISLFASYANAAKITCTGDISTVGFLPQYSGKVIAVNTDYRASIWATTSADEKTDVVMSILLAAFMADKEVSIQWQTLGATTCDQIEQWTGGVKIERVYINK